MPTAKIRLDELVFQLGLASSMKEAQALILSGKVLVNEQKVTKVGIKFSPEIPITLTKDVSRFASRGGLKLEGALHDFNVNPADRICLDIGASTGGFTDVLLQNGASKVYAFDVGYGQMIARLANDPRVIVKDRFNIKNISPADIDFSKNLLIVIDVSFISLKAVLPSILSLHQNGKTILEVVALLKPQFEARENELENGIVRNPQAHFRILKMILRYLKNEFGIKKIKITSSKIKGKEGNKEFFLHFLLQTPH